MPDLKDNLEKAMLAGVGAVAEGIEKTKIAIDEWSKKGSEILEQGKVANENLIHTVKAKIDEIIPKAPETEEEIESWLQTLSPEKIAWLKEKLQAYPSETEE